ncbi:MAG: thiamine pyrophosphate-binding protein [Spirochaetes bacterium]|jgi:indolepyruvate decarboxylase|nr:thiamine pyrophosphate-binding protein [Spirochaetota bacterium]
MQIGEYLISALRKTGIRHVFGIPGDYVLNFYDRLCRSGLSVINTCDEQGSGFAADAYARVTGFGAVCITYGVGGLKVVNSTAQAYAERSPVLVISGAPGMAERKGDPLLHHKVRSFDSQLGIFREVTAAQTVLGDPSIAAAEINRVIDTILASKRPGYIELPRDMVQAEAGMPAPGLALKSEFDGEALGEAVSEIMSMIASAVRPVVIAGVEVHRFRLQQVLLGFLDKSGFPFATTILGKSVVNETHPQFIGVYEGAMCRDDVREAVEGSDFILLAGTMLTDIDTGIFTHHFNPNCTVSADSTGIRVRRHVFQDIDLGSFLDAMTAAVRPGDAVTGITRMHEIPPFVPENSRPVTVDRLFSCINNFLDDETAVIADPGDALFGAVDLLIRGATEFMSPAYYASLGFAVPASLGVGLGTPAKRPLVLVGDGAFQMTGTELSTSLRCGLDPIVVVLNNGGYGTERPMIDGAFNDVQPWNYSSIPEVIGGGCGYDASTEGELVSALESARKNRGTPSIIDVKLSRDDFSPGLRKLTDRLRNRVERK